MLNDEQIFDILDGCAAKDILQQHNNLMENSEVYQKYFREIEAIHIDLARMPVEKPSADFTKNVMAAIPVAEVVMLGQRKKTWSTKMVYALSGVFGLALVACIGLAIFYKPDNADGVITIPFVVEFSDFITRDFSRIAVLLNLIMLLIVFDRSVLRPYFSQKKMTLG